MRIIPFLFSTIITLTLIVVLNKKWGSIPPLGQFLSPQQGFWQNAEPVDHDYQAIRKNKGRPLDMDMAPIISLILPA